MSKHDKQEGIMPVSAQRRIDQDPERKPRAKKNRKRWCKGKEGREHIPTIEFSPMWMSLGRKCHRDSHWYGCYHQRVCKTCGKVLEWSIPVSECPDLKREISQGRPSDAS